MKEVMEVMKEMEEEAQGGGDGGCFGKIHQQMGSHSVRAPPNRMRPPRVSMTRRERKEAVTPSHSRANAPFVYRKLSL